MTTLVDASSCFPILEKENKQQIERALFILPRDVLGGAEHVAMMIAAHIAKENICKHIDIYNVSASPSGSLEHFKAYGAVNIIYSGASRLATGVPLFAKFALGKRYDLVFSTHTEMNAMCCLLRKFGILKTKRLVTRESNQVFDYNFGRMSPVLRSMVKLYGAQDLIICQTQVMHDRFNEKTNGRFRALTKVLPNPIDLDEIERRRAEETSALNDIPADRTKIVWCGRLIESKRPQKAIQTLRRLHDLGRDEFHLVIVGDGPLRASVEAEIAQTGTAGRITLCGFQKNPIKIMARCDYGLLTSDLEGFPNVLLEMLAAGVKGVVTTNCAGDLEGIPGVTVAAASSPEELAAPFVNGRNMPPASVIRAHLRGRNTATLFGEVRRGL